MFRLLKLAAYGLLGYALYEFIRGAIGDDGPALRNKAMRGLDALGRGAERLSAGAQRGAERLTDAAQGLGIGGQGGQGEQQQSAGAAHNINEGDAIRANMTGPAHQGRVEETQDFAGGTVRHSVGRGVVS